jgi:hypothetical protein
LDPINTGPIDDPSDASVSRPNPGLDVSKGQEEGKGRSGGRLLAAAIAVAGELLAGRVIRRRSQLSAAAYY